MSKPVSLHQTIRSDIEHKILSGAWAPGYRIPVEHELMARYGCARMTVNKAITSLVDAGLIVRRKRSGSFVAHPHVRSAILDIPDIKVDIEARGAAYTLKLLTREIRAAHGPQEKLLAGGGKLLDIACVHLANGAPFALETRLISLKAVPAAADVEFSDVPPGSWLLAHVPWTEVENRISAVALDAMAARQLHLTPGAACLAIERRTWRGKTNITWVRQLFPGEAFDLVARFSGKQRVR